MARGASQSGASQNVPRGGGGRAAAGPSAMSRPTGGGGGGGGASRARTAKSAGGSGGVAGITRYWTDDAQGLKIGPTAVLVVALVFIGFVITLHIFGKFRK
eukprot:CAMPEP_0175822264 /NCGR_PEP_ID=MMETSP0107_2-20121207/9585_1 /TAXON_ID=195067 ORGANISM="Goniomonas pacifica, Strain CCMP1869" /NCGR_SAMPLE_ID=MMETSP0107_2 /ASSEMBLY_ACC=CAM_ASM_000203 /LENGTH=100 /DNA_ID=CAMNT_0017134717 /DNA_START=28 /DNA_END=330 /DNA_ORIENTATION=-